MPSASSPCFASPFAPWNTPRVGNGWGVLSLAAGGGRNDSAGGTGGPRAPRIRYLHSTGPDGPTHGRGGAVPAGCRGHSLRFVGPGPRIPHAGGAADPRVSPPVRAGLRGRRTRPVRRLRCVADDVRGEWGPFPGRIGHARPRKRADRRPRRVRVLRAPPHAGEAHPGGGLLLDAPPRRTRRLPQGVRGRRGGPPSAYGLAVVLRDPPGRPQRARTSRDRSVVDRAQRRTRDPPELVAGVYDLASYAVATLALSSVVWTYWSISRGIHRLGAVPLVLRPYFEDAFLGLKPVGSLALSLASAYFAFIALFLLILAAAPSTPAPGDIVGVGGFLSGLIALGLLLFFVPLRRLHHRMVRAKALEAGRLKEKLAPVFQEPAPASLPKDIGHLFHLDM